jgi:outer membrane immunogenic protein
MLARRGSQLRIGRLRNRPSNLPVTGGGPALGAVGGIQGGYNWQFAPAWVLGIEGDISWASLADHRTSGPILVSGGGVLIGSSVAMSANTEWLSSVRGKLGWIGWNTLWYVTGGGAWVNTEYTATTTVLPQAAGPNIPNLYQSNTSFNTTQSGWVIGGGAEWQATTNILIRAEYLYYNLHNGVTASAPFSPPIVNTPPLPVYSWSNYNVQVARIAASYKF